MSPYQRIFLLGIIIIAFGVLFQTTWSHISGSLGTVLIAIGGLLFIAAMARKQSQPKK